jgi:hypothetical protein
MLRNPRPKMAQPSRILQKLHFYRASVAWFYIICRRCYQCLNHIIFLALMFFLSKSILCVQFLTIDDRSFIHSKLWPEHKLAFSLTASRHQLGYRIPHLVQSHRISVLHNQYHRGLNKCNITYTKLIDHRNRFRLLTISSIASKSIPSTYASPRMSSMTEPRLPPAGSEPLSKRLKTDHKATIGTHNGTFHCDEALAVWLLRRTHTYKEAGASHFFNPNFHP